MYHLCQKTCIPNKTFIFFTNTQFQTRGYSCTCLPSMCKTLGSVVGTANKKKM
jgi:hypothetical protein